MLDIRHLPSSTGKSITTSQWFRLAHAKFQYKHPGSFIRNHRQFRLNISCCEDIHVNFKPLFLNLQDGRRPLVCLVTLLTVVISAIRVTLANHPRTDYQTDHRLVHPDR